MSFPRRVILSKQPPASSIPTPDKVATETVMAADRHMLTSITQALGLRLVLQGSGFPPLPPQA